jgi:hypothetical protein
LRPDPVRLTPSDATINPQMNDCRFGYVQHCRYLMDADCAATPSAAETAAHKIEDRRERFLPDQQAVLPAIRKRRQSASCTVTLSREKELNDFEPRMKSPSDEAR